MLELHTEMRVTSVCFVAVNAVAAVVDDGRVWASSDPGANMMEFLRQFEAWQIAIVAKPFILLVFAITVLYPCRRACEKYMREGRFKRLLLRRIN